MKHIVLFIATFFLFSAQQAFATCTPVVGGGNQNLPDGWVATLTSNSSDITDVCYDASDGSFTFEANGRHNTYEFAYTEQYLDGEIIARITDLEGMDGWSRTGVMVREADTGGSPYLFMGRTASNGGLSTYVDEVNGYYQNISQFPNCYNYWVKVKREGKVLSSYYSCETGTPTTWTKALEIEIPTLKDRVLVGLFAASNSATGQTGTYRLDNVDITFGGAQTKCETAVLVPINGDCVASFNAPYPMEGPQVSCTPETSSAAWFKFEAPASGMVTINTNAQYNDVLTVFSGTCGNWTTLDCTNENTHGFEGEIMNLQGLNAGQSYLVRVSTVECGFGTLWGDLCIEILDDNTPAPAAPANDLCVNAQAIAIGDACTIGTNEHATFDGPIPSLNNKADASVWYSFEATTTDVLIETNADFSDVITVFTGNCSGLTEIACTDYGVELNLTGLNIGQIYLIQVAGNFATIEGDLCIELKEENSAAPSNDECVGAINVNVGSFSVDGTNVSATYSGSPNPSCSFSPGSDIWYSFTAPLSGGVQLNTGADFMHMITLYSGTCGNFQERYCEEAPDFCSGYVTLDGLNSGQTYYLRISSLYNTFGYVEGNLSIEILDIEATSFFDPLDLMVTPNCIGDGIAQLTIQASGGIGNYTFLGHTQNDVFQTGDIYEVVVSDEQGCAITLEGTVDCGEVVGCSLTISLNQTGGTCSTGSALASVSGGTAPYTYYWDNGAATTSTNSLSIGTHTFTAIDNNGCVGTGSIDIQPSNTIITATTSTTDSDCSGASGTITVTANGGASPYTFDWNTGQVGSFVSGLSDAIYNVTVTDANGCMAVVYATVGFDCTLYACENTIPLACGSTITGDNTGQYQIVNSCNSYHDGDTIASYLQMYEFTPLASGDVTIDLTNLVVDQDLILYEGDPCDQTCLVVTGNYNTDAEQIVHPVIGGQTYYIGVRGWQQAQGTYTLSLTCPAIPNACNNTIPIACSSTITGDNTGVFQVAESCGLGGVNDTTAYIQMYEFIPTTTGDVTIDLTNLIVDHDLILFEGDPCDQTCLTTSINVNTFPEQIAYTVTGGQTYYIGVRGWIGAQGTYTLSLACPSAPTTCAVPTNISSLVISGNVAKINWDVMDDGQRYRIRYRTIGGSWVEKLTAGPENFRFLNDLTPSTTYEYQLKTLCTSLNSVWSSTMTFTTLSEVCDIPQSSNATVLSSTSATISWTANPADQKYKFRYKPTTGGSPWVEYTSLTVNTKTETGLVPGTEYKYKLKTKCSGGWTNWSANDFFTMSASINAGNLRTTEEDKTALNEKDINIFPNPTSGLLNIDLSGIDAEMIRIHSIHGQSVLEQTITQELEKVDLSQWPSNVYLLSVITKDQQVIIKQFVKK